MFNIPNMRFFQNMTIPKALLIGLLSVILLGFIFLWSFLNIDWRGVAIKETTGIIQKVATTKECEELIGIRDDLITATLEREINEREIDRLTKETASQNDIEKELRREIDERKETNRQLFELLDHVKNEMATLDCPLGNAKHIRTVIEQLREPHRTPQPGRPTS